MDNYVKVGVAAYLMKEGRLLMLLRKGAHGAGSWSVPGGHVEMGELPEQTVIREVMEEAGIEVKEPKFVGFTNDCFPEEGKQYITLIYAVEYVKGEAKLIEPEKAAEIRWVDKIPANVFTPLRNMLDGKGVAVQESFLSMLKKKAIQ